MNEDSSNKRKSNMTKRQKAAHTVRCSFCQQPESTAGAMINGNNNATICVMCVEKCHRIIEEARAKGEFSDLSLTNIPLPREFVTHLDQYVIGQEYAKKVLAVAVFNHYQRLHHNLFSHNDIVLDKANILLIGPTGCGKTLLARTAATKMQVPLALGDATALTEAGYVGEDVENLLLKLIHAANNDISTAEKGMIYIDEIDKIRRTRGNTSITRDVSGEGVQQALLKMLEGTISNVPPQGGRKHPEQQCIAVDTTNILFICGGTFDGIADIIAARLDKRQIGFISCAGKDKEYEYNELINHVTADDLIEFGMISEFVGRLPVIVPMNQLSEEQMIDVVTKPKNALVRQYRKMFQLINKSELEFTPGAIRAIVQLAKENDTGARALSTVFNRFMLEINFLLPHQPAGQKYLIDEQIVKGERQLFASPSNDAA